MILCHADAAALRRNVHAVAEFEKLDEISWFCRFTEYYWIEVEFFEIEYPKVV